MQNDYINIYNNLVKLTRNKNLYLNLKNNDTFSDRLIILLFHFAFFLKIYKDEISKKEAQVIFDSFIRQIELSIREIGYGDVAVNKKMKDLNKILYDILLKIENNEKKINEFRISSNLVLKYFGHLKDPKNDKFTKFETYFLNFYKFCFELSLKNMIKDALKFKN